jgi:UDP-N-acetylmuramoylalanine--D-glutamate ligase
LKRSNLIVGLGETGLSIAKYFVKQGIAFSVVDSRDSPPNLGVLNTLAPSVKCFVGGLDESVILSATTLYLSPGIDSRLAVFQKARNKGIKISSDIELFASHISKPILAVTGSNGKSTVTTLLAQCINECGLKALAIGNIGAPVLDHVEDKVDYYVIELSSFQLALLDQISCHTAVVLNLSPDHLDRHDGFDDYCKSKIKLYENAHNRVINVDDENVMKVQSLASNAVTVSSESSDAKYYCGAQNNLIVDGEVLLQASDLMLIGRHNCFNILVVLAFCDILSLPRAKVLVALKNFRGLDFRCECIAKHNAIAWINDSKATNVAASMSAIMSVLEMNPKQLVLIMGGQAKGQDFSNFALLKNSLITDVLLIGEAAEQLSEAFAQVATVTRCEDLVEAVALAHAAIKEGGVILFSPACASFDMFDNYLHRGMVFNDVIKEITK